MYAKQIVKSFQEQLNPDLAIFFKKNKEFFTQKTLSEYIAYTLNIYFPYPEEESIRESFKKISKDYKATRYRWKKAYNTNCTQHPSISDKNSVFYTTNKIFSLDTSKSNTVEDLKRVIEQWFLDKNAILVQFPLLYTKTKTTISKAFLLDVARNIHTIIKTEYNGCLNNFFLSYPQELINKPLFSPRRHQLKLHASSGELVDELLLADSDRNEDIVKLITRFPIETENTVQNAFDAKDMAIISFVMTHIQPNFFTDRKVTVSLTDIARVLYEGKISAKHYKMAAERCLSLSRCRYTYFDQDNITGISFNFFDSVVIEPDYIDNDRRKVDIIFGDILYRSIINKKVINIARNNYRLLTNHLSQILYYVMQEQRINLYLLSLRQAGHALTREYFYSFFTRAVRFYSKNKKDNIALINTCLDEFVEKKIAIKSYTFRSPLAWEIEFYPLSQEEYDDLL